MKTAFRFVVLLAVCLTGALLLALPGEAQTPTPIPIAANTLYAVCNITSTSQVCGRIRQGATQDPAAVYSFTFTGTGAGGVDVYESYDQGVTRKKVGAIVARGQTLTRPACGPCEFSFTPTAVTSGTVVITASISGAASTMAALPTPTHTPTPTATPTRTHTPTPTATPTPG